MSYKFNDINQNMGIGFDIERISRNECYFHAIYFLDNLTGSLLVSKKYSEYLNSPSNGDLISGFLKGFISIGKEVIKRDTTMKKLSYEDFEIDLLDGEYTTAVLITSGFTHQYTINKLKDFLDKFEKRFQLELKEFIGKTIIFEQSEDLVEEVFNFFYEETEI